MTRAGALLIALILACSGCGIKAAPKPEALEMELPDCPAPETPRLTGLDPALPLDSPKNVAILMERDDMIRAYIDGLLAALSCWRAKGGRENGSE